MGQDQLGSDQDKVEITACALCGGREARVFLVDGPYTLRRCRDCALVWVSPRFTEAGLRQVYSESYWSSASPKTQGYANYRRDEPLYLKTFRRRMRLVDAHVRRDGKAPGRVLDVGCAAGYFLKTIGDRGWDVHGVELSAEIAAHARERFGIQKLHVGTLDTAPWEPGSFDLLTMWDVVEHVPDFKALLRRARELLKPDGTLILETQNVDSSFARVLGRRWQHYKHQEHLYHFNPGSLRSLLGEVGFEVVELTPRFGGKYVSFGFIAERAARLGKVAKALLAPLNLFKAANVYVNLRDEMVVVARPRAAAALPRPSAARA